MPILPLPQFEADVKSMLDEQDRAAYEALKQPKTLVVRFGVMKMVGEYPYSGDIKPGCGSKIVVRTHRGTEIGEMLTSTCGNSGCGKSVSRKDMLGYIGNSGGRDYPFFSEGRALRVATREDMDAQAALEQSRHALKMDARAIAERINGDFKIVDAEPILGGEVLTFFYLSEERVDVRELFHALTDHFRRRIDLKQVGARDEARITADYERCGQYCCCKNFLKVLKPVSMKSAKVQKATLDPLKISGRCGRLMCCLRYEDETYEDLRKKLPKKKSRTGTPEGDGLVLDSQILTQLVLVLLDEPGPDGKDRTVAIAVEDLTPPINAKAPVRAIPEPPAFRGGPPRSGPRPEMRAPEARPEGRPDARPEGRPDNRPPGNPDANPQARQDGPQAPRQDRAPSQRPEGRPDGRQDGRPEGRQEGRPDGRQDPRQGTRPPRQGGPQDRPPNSRQDRGPERGPDRGPDRNPDRNPDRPPGQSPQSQGPRPPRGDRPPQPQQQRGPQAPQGPQPPRDQRPPADADSADTFDLDDIETDTGDGPSLPPQGDGSRRRRRRRRRGGPGGGPGSGPGGPSGGPPAP